MSCNDLQLRLLAKLRAGGQPTSAVGIDLGTTKSSLACASWRPDRDTITCECVEFEQVDGTRRVALPSAVALIDGAPVFGVEALQQRGRCGMLPERNLFFETKNQIGLRYTYARAPQGYRTPQDIATALLGHLRDVGREKLPRPVGMPAVVTVPASFHGAQRLATLGAAERAFHRVDAGGIRLLDEPYAAFVDLKFRAPEQAVDLLLEGANVLVFDFGGGTCDVAIFRIDSVRGGALGARLLGTSRYHRLGGGDIDRAIVHDVLLPALLADNDLERWSISWRDKRRIVEPQLLGVAEQLKIALSMRMAGLMDAGQPAGDDLQASAVGFDVDWNGRRLHLAQPRLDVAAFGKLLKPFLDPEPPPEAGDEYVQRSSMFAPIAQALFRAGLEAEDIHGVLLCGSSSLLPPVRAALETRFPGARHVLSGDARTLEGSVARGAALQALSLQVLGEPLIAPVCSANLSLRVVSGNVPLARAGDSLPGASREPVLLRPARDSAEAASQIEVAVVSDGERLIGRSVWSLPPPARTSDRLALDWRIDENQCVELRLTRVGDDETEPFEHRFDAPITHRDPGQIVRCRMLERDEAIRNSEISGAALGPAFEQHARDCATLGEYERALHFVTLAMQERGQNETLLNLRGIYRERIGDLDGARESYEQAGDCACTRFNLALLLHRNGEDREALAAIGRAIELESARAHHALRGDILAAMSEPDGARLEWQDAVAGAPDWDRLDDFELGWMQRAANGLRDDALVRRIRERRQCNTPATIRVPGVRVGELPEHVGEIAT